MIMIITNYLKKRFLMLLNFNDVARWKLAES
jgi:hypothetical protein